jgi:HD-GYP domain-containing protein (c-di-GMP phosphodiesterase class II)
MAADPRDELAQLARQLEELNQIGAALAAERDTTRLLELILTNARDITGSDAGSLYLTEPAPADTTASAIGSAPIFGMSEAEPTKILRFVIAQNDSVAVPFTTTTLDITDGSIAGHVALTREPLRLDDAYAMPPGVPYSFNRSFDQATGYRTQSVLAVPMRTPKGAIVGVVQLINARQDGRVVPFGDRQQALAVSLAAQAAVAVENSHLYAEIQGLFEGFVRASVIAIEARDPATSGHSFRVANLTVAFAEAVDRDEGRTFGALRFSREQMRTIRYASLLHDFGKVAVREEILVMAKKLYPSQLDLIRERFKLARRSHEVSSMQARLDCLLADGREAYLARVGEFESHFAEACARLDRALAAVELANEPTIVPDGTFDEIARLAELEFFDCDGAARPLLQEGEAQLLSLRKGTLSEDERAQIESHVMQSYRFLTHIPWTREIRDIPAIAVGHHEKLNGRGYPRKLSAPDIPIQTRMMTISDIFDALSAADRPYKRAIPMERALHILGLAVKDGELDADLFGLFVEARIFDKWLIEPHPY